MTQKANLNIIHGDLDAFFAAVEQRENPELQGKPVIVGGQPDSRGVVSTCSYEARSYGVRSAMPLRTALKLCPMGIFLPVNMKLYQSVSRQVMKIMSEYSPLMEAISIDEAFLDVGGCERLFGTAKQIARLIKRRIWQEQNLRISMGISYNKYLAKLATELGKPDGLKVIGAGDVPDILTPLPVGYLWGVGEKTLAILIARGINTIGDLRQFQPSALQRLVGSAADRLLQLSNGIDERMVGPTAEPSSMGKEITFAEDVADYSFLRDVLLDFADHLAHRLRKKKMITRTVILKVRYADFRNITRSRTFAEATDSERVIFEQVELLLAKLGGRNEKVRLIGLSLSNLSSSDLQQGMLFGDESHQEHNLDQALDELKGRYGEGVIVRASHMNMGDTNKD